MTDMGTFVVPKGKLTERQVADILETYVPGDRLRGGRALAKKYDVSPQTISSLLRGKSWKHMR